AHNDRLAPRQADLNLDLINLGLLRAAVWRLQDDAAAGHAAEVFVELRHLFPHPFLDRRALLDAMKMDLDGSSHGRALPNGKHGLPLAQHVGASLTRVKQRR